MLENYVLQKGMNQFWENNFSTWMIIPKRIIITKSILHFYGLLPPEV